MAAAGADRKEAIADVARLPDPLARRIAAFLAHDLHAVAVGPDRQLFARGVSMEYFIEGGRSRTGRAGTGSR